MDQVIPIILKSGKLSRLSPATEEILGAPDFHSGYSVIASGDPRTVSTSKQMISFIALTLDDTLTLEGDLWLA